MPPKKKILAVVKIQLPAGGATPAPPVGTALGPHGVQTMDFVKQYNAATEKQAGSIVPVEISIYEDRTFSFVLKTPPAAALLRQAAGLEKGAATAGRETVATCSRPAVDAPLSIPAAWRSMAAAGGVLRTNENVRSS